MEKRIRGANYLLEEKLRLINIAAKRKHLIENKKTDGISQQDKKKAWEELTAEFNAYGTSNRTTTQLKILYENIK